MNTVMCDRHETARALVIYIKEGSEYAPEPKALALCGHCDFVNQLALTREGWMSVSLDEIGEPFKGAPDSKLIDAMMSGNLYEGLPTDDKD